MHLVRRKSWALLLALAVAVILATAVATETAQAQEPPPPHDLSLRYRHGLVAGAGEFVGWIFVLTNQGGQHAHSGQVKVSFTPYRDGTVSAEVASTPFDIGLDPKFGSFDPATGIWHFRNLRPGETAELALHATLHGSTPGSEGRWLVKGRGEIISSLPKEESMFLYNNVTREAWKYAYIGREHAAEGDAVVDMLVSDRFPQMNDTVDFTVRFNNRPGYRGSLYDTHHMYEVRVKVSPSPGLELVSAEAPSRTYDLGTSTTRDDIQISSSFDLATGIWNLGTVPESRIRYQIDMPVTVRYTGSAPLEEACLTAELVNVVPPERPADDLGPDVPDTQRNNRVRVCLGKDPTVLIRDGEIGIFTVHPCVGATAYPCNDQDTLELVARMSRAQILEHDIGIDRSDGLVEIHSGAGEQPVVFLQPETIVIQVEDT